MQTPLQKAIDILQKRLDDQNCWNEKCKLLSCQIIKINKLISEERKVIEDAYNQGYNEGFNFGLESGQDYFNNTFKQ